MKNGLSAEQLYDQWENLTPINDQLPAQYTMPNGDTGIVDGFAYGCTSCRTPMGPDDMRGHVDLIGKHVLQIDSIGFCSKCHAIGQYRTRIRDEGKAEFLLSDGTWQEVILQATETSQKEGLFSKLGRIIRQLLTKN